MGNRYLGQDFLFHVPVILYSPIGILRWENGVSASLYYTYLHINAEKKCNKKLDRRQTIADEFRD